MKSKMTQEQKDAALLTLIESKTAKGRATIDNLTQSQRSLNKDWQDFTASIGPGVTTVLDDMFKMADWGVGRLQDLDNWLVKVGQDNQFWGGCPKLHLGKEHRGKQPDHPRLSPRHRDG
jgi:hypothetical protein